MMVIHERVHLEIDIFDNDKKRELHVEVKSEISDLTKICQNGVQTFLVIKAEFDIFRSYVLNKVFMCKKISEGMFPKEGIVLLMILKKFRL